MFKKLIPNSNISKIFFEKICLLKKSGEFYPLFVLTQAIDQYRVNIPEDEYSDYNDEEIINKNNREEDIINIPEKMVELLVKLNNTKDFSEIFGNLNITNDGGILILELTNILNKNYIDDSKQIRTLTECLDTKKTGKITYSAFFTNMSGYIPKYNHSIKLHAKYLMWIVTSNFKGDIKNYLTSKKLDEKRNLELLEFTKLFKSDFLDDEELVKKTFNAKKETVGTNKNKILMKKFIELLLESSELIDSDQTNSKSLNKVNLTKEEIKNKVDKLIKELELSNKTLISVFNANFNEKIINATGNCQIEVMKKILNDNYKLDYEVLMSLVNYFGNINDNLFNICKLVEYLQQNSTNRVDVMDIISKIETKIKKSKIYKCNKFCEKYNLNALKAYSLIEIVMLFPAVFQTTLYETYVIFIEIAKDENNSLSDDYKINLDFLFQKYDIYKLFKDDIKAEAKEGQLDDYTKGIVNTFKSTLTAKPMEVFKKYDKNKNGTLSAEEMLSCISDLVGNKLNDSQKLMILKVADKNNDDNVNYFEFVNFLNSDFSVKNANINVKNVSTNVKDTNTKDSKDTKVVAEVKENKVSMLAIIKDVEEKPKVTTTETTTKKKLIKNKDDDDDDGDEENEVEINTKTTTKNKVLSLKTVDESPSKVAEDENIKVKVLPKTSDKNKTFKSNIPIEKYNIKIADYFVDFEGNIIKTILNSEEAALAKCEEIFESLNNEGEEALFFDKDFGSQPDNATKSKYSLFITGAAPKGQIDASLIEWYRMGEICDGEHPKFTEDGVSSNDVMQGAIGDCWFISALAVLATKDHLLKGQYDEKILDDQIIDSDENIMLSTGTFPPLFHCFRRKGLFCFRFFKDFAWRYVLIDDRLPCKKIRGDEVPKLLYAKCRSENEFWVPLIEKAFAKLHGCYETLVSGFIDDGLVDLTGLVARKIFITQNEMKKRENIEQLWQTIMKYTSNETEVIVNNIGKEIKAKIFTNNNSMMGCSIDAKVVESEVRFIIFFYILI